MRLPEMEESHFWSHLPATEEGCDGVAGRRVRPSAAAAGRNKRKIKIKKTSLKPGAKIQHPKTLRGFRPVAAASRK